PRQPGTTAPVSRAVRSDFPNRRRLYVLGFDAEPPGDDLDSFCCVARNRAPDLFPVQRAAQQASTWHRRRGDRRHSSAVRQDVIVRLLIITRPTKVAVSRRFL